MVETKQNKTKIQIRNKTSVVAGHTYNFSIIEAEIGKIATILRQPWASDFWASLAHDSKTLSKNREVSWRDGSMVKGN